MPTNAKKSARLPKPILRYTGLALRNFRGFRSTTRVPLAPLTFLVGPNSSGKSSLFDSILLLAQTRFNQNLSFLPRWGGPLVDLGSYVDTVYGHNSRLPIRISTEVLLPQVLSSRVRKPDGVPLRIDFEIRTTKGDPVGVIAKMRVVDLRTDEWINAIYSNDRGVILTSSFASGEGVVSSEDLVREQSYYYGSWYPLTRELPGATRRKGDPLPKKRRDAFNRLFAAIFQGTLFAYLASAQRVSSGRAAPSRWYPIGPSTEDRPRPVGGSTVFNRVDPASIQQDDRHSGASGTGSPRARLASVLEALQIADRIQPTNVSPYHASIEVRDSLTGVVSNLIDVGYGASQVIPVIQACLNEALGPLFIEQPEIHLHPKAQGALAELLVTSSANRQLIVETHSVHMINRARLGIARGDLEPDHVIIHFVSRDEKGSRIHTIPLDEHGEFLASWPEGFFDERYEDTLELLRLRGREDER